LPLKTTSNFNLIASLAPYRIWGLQGSQGAAKTFSVLAMIINSCTTNPKLEVYIASAELTKMRTTVMKDFIKLVDIIGCEHLITSNLQSLLTSATLVQFKNGSTVKFIGLDKEDIGKGLRSDIVFVNEANKITFEAYRELTSRAKRIIVDFNPNKRFWYHTEVMPNPECGHLVLTFEGNELLSVQERNTILESLDKGFHDPNAENLFTESNIKNNYWANKWRVYGLGLEGAIEGTVFNYSLGKFDESLPYQIGLDFGFVNDPDAALKVAIDEKRRKVYLSQLMYASGQPMEDLAIQVKQFPNGVTIADSAEERLIQWLSSKTSRTIIPVKKGPGSVMIGIKLMQNYELIVDFESKDLIDELNSYIWNKNGDAPIDANNHLIDAARYVIYMQSNNKQQAQLPNESQAARFNKGHATGAKYKPF
jgi:phage terminase large subunit